MWISNKISNSEKLKRRKNSSADVTISQSENLVVQNSNEFRNIKLVSPTGISYVPVQGDKTIIIPMGEENVCLGSVFEADDLQPGELALCSAGGAKIVLKNNGEVVINGNTVPALEE